LTGYRASGKKTITDIKQGWKEIEGRQPQQQRPIPSFDENKKTKIQVQEDKCMMQQKMTAHLVVDPPWCITKRLCDHAKE
jgi:hypothetical protein